MMMLETIADDYQEEFSPTLCCEFHDDPSGYLGGDDCVSYVSGSISEGG